MRAIVPACAAPRTGANAAPAPALMAACRKIAPNVLGLSSAVFCRSRAFTAASKLPVPAALVAPGHPLLDAVVDVTVERHASTLKHAAVLVDPRDHGQTPRLLVGVEQRINDGHSPARTLSKRFDFVEPQNLIAGGVASSGVH